MLCHTGMINWEKVQLWGHPAAALALLGGDIEDVFGLCPVVHGRRVGGMVWAET